MVNKPIKRNTMKSVAYNEAMEYALDVLKAVKESGYEMDYPLEQFVNVSIRIGACVAKVEVASDFEEMFKAADEAKMNACESIYLADVLSRIEEYKRIPFESLRQKCESLHVMHINDNSDNCTSPEYYNGIADELVERTNI